MKDLIRMNQLAGLITENQAQKMLAVLNEETILKEGLEALNPEEAKIYFDKSKYNLHQGDSPETYIILKAGESYSPTAPNQGILYTPKHKYGSWAKSTSGVEGSYAIEK